ncbi:phosphoribosyltransferase [Sandarakinorhabdus sp.]|uniref:phosphoribosyltransferase n=1 Tax=Sandarakinorhabdus sp. TaxID=1916663 RepID=UPI0035693CD0
MSDVKKIWLTAEGLLGDSFRLARAVLESGFRPTHLVGIWRGGAPIGIAVQEFFDVHGVDCDHIAIRTTSYTGIDRHAKAVKVYALGYLIDSLTHRIHDGAVLGGVWPLSSLAA